MQRIALDTNAYRALDEGNTKLSTLVRKATRIGVPLTVVGELYFGFFNGSKQSQNIANLQRFLTADRVEMLSVDQETAKIYGEIATELRSAGRPTQQNDVWIAALCKQHGYVLATADKAFSNIVGLEVASF